MKTTIQADSKDAGALVAEALARPSGYAEVRLGMALHPKQAAVLDDLFSREKSRVGWFCGNEVGKTSRVATAAILYAVEILGARVQYTSASDRQIKEQLGPNLRRMAHLFPRWEFLDRSIKVAEGINQALFYTARDQGTFQGFHEEGQGERVRQLIIVDEAAAVRDEILGAAEDRCNPTWLLVMGSPLDPKGKFYQMSRDLAAFYSLHTLAKTECTSERTWPGGRGWHDVQDMARTVAKNCGLDLAEALRIVRSGDDGDVIQDPLTLSSIFGRFALFVQYALMTLTEWQKCIDNPPARSGEGDRHCFLDFAAGRAKNVIAVRDGNRVWIDHAWRERNTMAAVGEFVTRLKKLEREIGLKPAEVDGDGDGLGGPMVARIQELGLPIGDYHGGQPARFNPERYANGWSEAWGEGAARMKGCDIIVPNNPDFQGQVLGRQLKRRSDGRFILESKEEMAARGVASPDEADAILQAMMPSMALRSYSTSGRGEQSFQAQLRDYNDEMAGEVLPGAYCP